MNNNYNLIMVKRLLETIGFSANNCFVSPTVIKLLKVLATDNTSYLSWLPKEIFKLVENKLRTYLKFNKPSKKILFKLMKKYKYNKYMLIVNNDDIFILNFDEEFTENDSDAEDEDEDEDSDEEDEDNNEDKIRNKIYSYKYFLIQSKTISYKTFDNMKIVIDNVNDNILSINIRDNKNCMCCNSLKIWLKDTTIYFVRHVNIATRKKNNAELLHNIIIRNLR